MRAFDQGSLYRVTVSAAEVYDFMQSWPCSGLSSSHGVSFTFDKRNGDLVDAYHPGSEDGGALLALSQDAQAYGRKLLRLT
jgi:hypothetical protein